MLEEASALLAHKQETEMKQKLLDSFCKHFLISDEDLTMLTSSAEPINEHYFEVLSRVKQIHKDCELLLGYENQRLGLELMEQTTRNLDAGYKKLYNWTQREFKGLDLEDPHISGSIRRSLRALSERPALFQNCLDSFAEARQSTVFEAFQKALTDSNMGATRAINFSTHDPLRYMGDMLAWVHSATVSEVEALEGLFISDADEIARGLHSGKNADPWARLSVNGTQNEADDDQKATFDGHAALNSLISRNMASVAHTLTQRISVIIRNFSDPVEIYKAYNLLSFYHDMFLRLIRNPGTTAVNTDSSDNGLLDTLTSLQSSTFKHFETAALEKLHATIDEAPSRDLTPPSALSEALAQFTQIIQTRGPTLSLPEFTKLYTTFLAPVLTSCADLADLAGEQPDATAMTKTIYKLNYTSLVRNVLETLVDGTGTGSSSARQKVPTAQQPLQSAETEILGLQESLSNHLSETFLETSGWHNLQTLLHEPLSTSSSTARKKHLLAPLDLSTTTTNESTDSKLEILAHQLDTFLASALMDAQDDLSNLIDKTLAKKVLNEAVHTFVSMFTQAVDMLEEIDEEVERERLRRGMKLGGKHSGADGDGDGDGHKDDDEDEDEDDENVPMLRDVYPRTVEEVQALLS